MAFSQTVSVNFSTDSAVTQVQAFSNFPITETLAQVGLYLVSLSFDQLLVTHGNTSISLATLEYHQQAVDRLITV